MVDTEATDVVRDPVFGTAFRFRRGHDPDGTAVQHVEFWVAPGGGVPPHRHPAMDEVFTVRSGRLQLLSGRTWVELGPGESVRVPRRTRHAFRNRGVDPAHADSEARPPSTLEAFLTQAAGLSRAGLITRLGIPRPRGLLPAAVLVEAHRGMVTMLFPAPPPLVQRVLFGPLARLARRRGLTPEALASLDDPGRG